MKKANPKPRPAPAVPAEPISARPIEPLLLDAQEKTERAVTLFTDRITVVQRERQILQPDLATVALFERLHSTAAQPVKSFKGLAQALYAEAEKKAREDAGLAESDPAPAVRLNVAPGTRVLAFEDNRRITPQWKEIAQEHAQILHAVAAAVEKGDKKALRTLLEPFQGVFNEKTWEEAIRRKTPRKGDLTPKIVGG